MRAIQTVAGPSATLAKNGALSEYALVSALAHEVRGALAVMEVSLELLDDRQTWTSGVAPRLVQRIRRSVAWINGLVENTRWAAAEVDPAALEPMPILLFEPIEAAIALATPLLEQKQQVMQVDCPKRLPWVYGDRLRLTQVIVNLLTNASAYAPSGDTIKLVVSAVSGRARVQVIDHGPGIAPREEERIFRPHVRGSAAMDGDVPGFGLGLHLARTFIELHEGTIGVKSVPGEGACFWFELPCIGAAERDGTHGARRNGT